MQCTKGPYRLTRGIYRWQTMRFTDGSTAPLPRVMLCCLWLHAIFWVPIEMTRLRLHLTTTSRGGRSRRLADPGRMLRNLCLMRARSSARTTRRDEYSSSPWGMSTTHSGSQMYLPSQTACEHLQLCAV